MQGNNLVSAAGPDAVASCCNDCSDGAAQSFKAGLPTKRVRVQIAPDDTSDKQRWVRYQTEKCGPLEYNIYDPGWFMSAVQHIGYELDPRSSIWADGLAATPPPSAPRGFDLGCMLLEAKYSQPNRDQALYTARAHFVRTRARKWWLKVAYDRYKARQAAAAFLGRRFGRRPRPIKTFARYAGEKWQMARLRAVAQIAAYAAFCRNPDTPFTRFVMICGERSFVATYFRAITLSPGLVVHAPFGGPHWRT